MVLVGLWHGARWNFVMFGFLSGIDLAGYYALRIFARKKKQGLLLGNYWWSYPVAVIGAFIQINLIMIFFRSPTLGVAWNILSGIFRNPWTWLPQYNIYLFMIAFLWMIHFYRGTFMKERKRIPLNSLMRAIFWAFLILLLIYASVDVTEKFIYFQF